MDDLRQRFAELDVVAVPDLWPDIERRAGSQATTAVRPHTTWRGPSDGRPLSPAMLALLAGLLVATLGGGILIGSSLNWPTPSVDASPAPMTTILGCILQQPRFQPERVVGAPECEMLAAQAAAHLPEGRGTPSAILVTFDYCPDWCEAPNGVARDGNVTIEYADGDEPIELTFTGPLEAAEFEEADRNWSGLKEPVSPRVDGSGPFPFALGHCGLSWYVDFDGSFWVPVGLVDGGASAVVNAEEGEMLLLSRDRVQFRGQSGFTANLARFPGPKHIWICR